MSKQIGIVYGAYEQIHYPETQVTIYGDADMFMTSFSGGAERGPCLQLTIQAGPKAAYIQLKKVDVTKLVDILAQWLGDHQ